MGQNLNDNKDIKKWAILTTIGILILWSLTFLVFKLWEEPDERGTFGDMFGAINALFSGLAFAGIIITIILQSRELKLQREETVGTRKVLEEQSRIMNQQQNDATFFNLLQNHRQLIDSFKYGQLKINFNSHEGYKNKREGFQTSTEIVSGYEGLGRISELWKVYFSSYSESFEKKRIIDLELCEYEDPIKLIEKYPITLVFMKELLNIHKFIEANLAHNSEFYKNTLFHSLTLEERFIFEAIYSNLLDEREQVYYDFQYYKNFNFVEFEKSPLPIVRINKIKVSSDYNWIKIDTNSAIKSMEFIIFSRRSRRNLFIHEIHDVSDYLVGYGSSIWLISFLKCLYRSDLDIKNYPFSNTLIFDGVNFVYLIKVESHGELITVAFQISFTIQSDRSSNSINLYEFANFNVSMINADDYDELQEQINLYSEEAKPLRPFLSKIEAINASLENYFLINETKTKVRAKDLMRWFIEDNIFTRNDDGGPIRDLLRNLDALDELGQIPYVLADRKKTTTHWYFKRI